MKINQQLVEATIERFKRRTVQRERNLNLIRQGRYLECDTPERVEKFLNRHGLTRRDVEPFVKGESSATPPAPETAASPPEPSGLERILGTNDLMGIAFLERGLQVARTIGRIWISVSGGTPLGFGTGFLISPRLLMTNNHVLEGKAIARQSLVQFDYQIGLNGKFIPTTIFNLDPEAFYLTDAALDYTLVAVQPFSTSNKKLESFGWNPLIEEEGKAIISQWLNIIQHPNGEAKQIGFRENQLIDVLESFLHYKTDTAPGSSGSPVYNDRWEVVGLHHSGIWEKNAAGQIMAIDGRVWDKSMGEHRIKWIANEGARVSRILAHARRQAMNQAQIRLFDQIFTAPPAFEERPETNTPPEQQAVQPAAQVRVSNDGTATWTIPLSVSVKLGDFGVGQVPQQPQPPLEQPLQQPLQPIADGLTTPRDDAEKILAAARSEFRDRADILEINLGYVFKNGWITDEEAIVFTVRGKKTLGALRESNITPLPTKFKGMPVEVTTPTVEQLLRMARKPESGEAFMSEREPLAEEITYHPPAGIALTKITANMRVVAHVSPDAGWNQLKEFLRRTQRRLTVGMYDFGAPHIVEAIEALAQKQSFTQLTLVMQSGESLNGGTKANDLPDAEVVERFRTAFDNRFRNAWVKIGYANGWVANSYHIKVAVRDRAAFWLSSGNWQSSNQPDANPLTENPRRKKWLNEYNREWHTIVENPQLARVFEKFLENDFENNRQFVPNESVDNFELLIPAINLIPSPTEAANFAYFEPFDQNRQFTVTPLLTPDNYHGEVLKLIRSASAELLIQNQTFNAPENNQTMLRELIDAVIEKQRSGIRVRIIFRDINGANVRANLSALKRYGLKTEYVKVQNGCHTKGIVVDRRKVVVGSQNWSNLGVSDNRDASLLFDDEELANYFAGIFDHDWQNIAVQKVGSDWQPNELVTAASLETPPNTIRLSLKDYFEML